MTRRAARQGDPEPRHQVSLLGPATPSDHLTPEGTDRNPCAWRGETPLATRSHWKALPRPELRPSAQQGAASGTALRRRVSQPRLGLTRRTAGSRSSRPAAGWASPPVTPAASCRPGPTQAGGVGWGQPGPHAVVRRGRRCR